MSHKLFSFHYIDREPIFTFEKFTLLCETTSEKNEFFQKQGSKRYNIDRLRAYHIVVTITEYKNFHLKFAVKYPPGSRQVSVQLSWSVPKHFMKRCLQIYISIISSTILSFSIVTEITTVLFYNFSASTKLRTLSSNLPNIRQSLDSREDSYMRHHVALY